MPQAIKLNIGLQNDHFHQTSIGIGSDPPNQELAYLSQHDKPDELEKRTVVLSKTMKEKPINAIKLIVKYEAKLHKEVVSDDVNLFTLTKDKPNSIWTEMV